MIDCKVRQKALLLVNRTGSGKSLVMLTAATLIGGVALIIMPTLSLASDQLEKFTNGKYKNLNTVHLDEVKLPHEVKKVVKQLTALKKEPRRRRPFASPQVLTKADNPLSAIWSELMVNSAKWGLLNLVVGDEAHMHLQQGLTFRKEFLDLKDLVDFVHDSNDD
jgi:superfamily II DNA helicase RecQ